MNKTTIASILLSVVLIGGAVWLSSGSTSGTKGSQSAGVSTTVTDGRQFVDITAKGGYNPRVINAKADMPLVVKMKTENTFDCSAYVVIPSLGYRGTLNQDGTTEIPIPSQPAGTTIRGSCGMGMYGFAINFN
jgi:plastocyanin domain-containing protein